MNKLRVLIVEDEALTAIDLEYIVLEITPAEIITESSVTRTKRVLNQPFDFAFLDIDVTNGKTFEVAQLLGQKGVPFVFVSGGPRAQVPEELRWVPFIAKPFRRSQIAEVLPTK